MPTRLPKIGERFLGRYDLQEVVGMGGYGRIYRAHQIDLDREVALKVLDPPAEDDTPQTFVERFAREAAAIARLTDPHTVTMHDYGEHDGLLYMVLEYIDGHTLKDMIAREGAMPPSLVVHVIRQILMSLMDAHGHGIVHRDIKPANIMLYEHLDDPHRVKVLDFGLAKSQQTFDAEDLTAANVLVGTPRYMSPEQVRSEDVGPQSDIYSLGLVAAEMLSGTPVITENGAVTIVARHIDPREFALDLPQCPAQLQATLQRMLRKDPAERFPDAPAVLEALQSWDAPVAEDDKPATPVGAIVALVAVVLLGLIFGASSLLDPDDVPAQATAAAAEEPDAAVAPQRDAAPPTAAAAAAPSDSVDKTVLRALYSADTRLIMAVGAAERVAGSEAERRARARARARRDRTSDSTQKTPRDLEIFEP